MVLDLLEDAIEADDQVEAVHQQPDADEADERELVVAQRVADAALVPAEVAERARRARDAAVPRDRVVRRAGHDRGEEVVEAERERGRPGADEEHLEQRVRELARRAPEAERPAEVLELYDAGVGRTRAGRPSASARSLFRASAGGQAEKHARRWQP